MESANQKIARFEKQERLRKLKYFFIAAIFVSVVGLLILGFTAKTTQEIEAEVTDFRLMESDTGSYVRAVFKTRQGNTGTATLPRGYTLQKGDTILCIEMKTHFGTTKYRFLRKS